MREYRIGPFRLQIERLSLTCDGKRLVVGRKVVETLLALAERAGEPVSKAELLDRIWPEGCVEEANLAQNVFVLRKLFRRHGEANPIETAARYGYRLALTVEGPDLLYDLGAAPKPPPRTRSVKVALAAALCAVVALAFSSSAVVGHRNSSAAQSLSPRGARLYAIGTYYWNMRTRDSVAKSVSYFSQVVDSDPADPRGYAGLADANAMMGAYCYGTQKPDVYFARARAYAETALIMDPHSGEAHAALGVIAFYTMDLQSAKADLQRAISLKPDYGPAQLWYGATLFELGRRSEGIAHMHVASRLDPLSASTAAWLGYAAYKTNRLDESIALSRQALELSPDRADVLSILGRAYEAKGNVDDAIGAFQRFGAVDPYHRPESAALLARAYAIAHRLAQAHAQFDYALAHSDATNTSDLFSAAAALGERHRLSSLRPSHTQVSWMS